MKKILILMLAIMSAGAVSGQKPKVAIYTEDKSEKNYAVFAGEYLTNAIVKRGTYEVYERTADFLNLINKEQGDQRRGTVSKTQIAKLGKQLGVEMVCAVKIGMKNEQAFISAKLIDVETSSIKGTARPVMFNVGDMDGFEKACETIIASMFEEKGRHGGSSTSPSTSKNKRRNVTCYSPDGIEMIYVEGKDSLKGFYIGKYEVTQAQWQNIMGSNPSAFKGNNNPVEQVSWNDVQKFIKKLNDTTGRNYRLPTVSEWEYAAHEGTNNSNYEYSGSNNIETVAWFGNNSDTTTHPVGQKKPNALGIYDMTGNVWEWCQDCYDNTCSYRINRGGSWNYRAANCRIADWRSDSPSNYSNNLGFRLLLSEQKTNSRKKKTKEIKTETVLENEQK